MAKSLSVSSNAAGHCHHTDEDRGQHCDYKQIADGSGHESVDLVKPKSG